MKITTLQVGPIGTNCYILCDEEAKACAVVDPGGNAGRVAAAAAETGCAPCAIRPKISARIRQAMNSLERM